MKELIEEHGVLMRGFALKLTKDANNAEDLYQDTVLRIIKYADSFRDNTCFKAWATTIMRNTFINGYRKKIRRKIITFSECAEHHISKSCQPIDNGGESNISYVELLSIVNDLPDDFRIPFWMFYQGFKYREIADELGEPVGTIKSRIFCARKKLRLGYMNANAVSTIN